MKRKHLIASVAILFAFAIGLVGFYMVSSGLPDGLDRTIEQNGGEEAAPVYNAPLSYGDNYLTTLIMGAVGFIVTLAAMYGVLRLRKKARSADLKE